MTIENLANARMILTALERNGLDPVALQKGQAPETPYLEVIENLPLQGDDRHPTVRTYSAMDLVQYSLSVRDQALARSRTDVRSGGSEHQKSVASTGDSNPSSPMGTLLNERIAQDSAGAIPNIDGWAKKVADLHGETCAESLRNLNGILGRRQMQTVAWTLAGSHSIIGARVAALAHLLTEYLPKMDPSLQRAVVDQFVDREPSWRYEDPYLITIPRELVRLQELAPALSPVMHDFLDRVEVTPYSEIHDLADQLTDISPPEFRKLVDRLSNR